jgi:purine-binding chemotaxis protein CheW
MINKDSNDYKELIKKNKLNAQKNKEVKQIAISIGTVVFRLESEYYCIEVTYVSEIIREKKFTRLPNSPQYIKGLINLRGDIIPVVDLKKIFNLQSYDNDGI